MSSRGTFDPAEVARWCGGQWVPRLPGAIQAVVHDTKKVTAGALFVALRGARFDGHEFVGQAVQAGAVAALVSRTRLAGLQALDIPLLVVEEPGRALQEIAAGYRVKLGLSVVGVTGSTGKTTVKEMIACLLAETHSTARTKGNWNNEIGLPLSILAIAPDCQVAVLELGISHPGEMAPLCAIARPDWGVITNVGPVHLEFFASVEAIAREKSELLKSLPAGGIAVLSQDDPNVALLRACAPGRVITISIQPHVEADYRLVSNEVTTGICRVEDRLDGGIHEFRLSLPGLHNRSNALMAIAVARGFGVGWDRIASAFERFVGPPMRWEQTEAGGVTFINDAYNANPVSMRAAIDTFRTMAVAGRKWLVLGDMLELGQTEVAEHRALGRSLEQGEWAGLLTVGTLGAHIAAGAGAAGLPAERVHACETLDSAVDWLRNCIAPGDAILVKASRGKHLDEIVVRLSGFLVKD
jgi:UDP-N-acetylmuramoyl-tripeptide--D-alanyl-D-alanine ligase